MVISFRVIAAIACYQRIYGTYGSENYIYKYKRDVMMIESCLRLMTALLIRRITTIVSRQASVGAVIVYCAS